MVPDEALQVVDRAQQDRFRAELLPRHVGVQRIPARGRRRPWYRSPAGPNRRGRPSGARRRDCRPASGADGSGSRPRRPRSWPADDRGYPDRENRAYSPFNKVCRVRGFTRSSPRTGDGDFVVTGQMGRRGPAPGCGPPAPRGIASRRHPCRRPRRTRPPVAPPPARLRPRRRDRRDESATAQNCSAVRLTGLSSGAARTSSMVGNPRGVGELDGLRQPRLADRRQRVSRAPVASGPRGGR